MKLASAAVRVPDTLAKNVAMDLDTDGEKADMIKVHKNSINEIDVKKRST